MDAKEMARMIAASMTYMRLPLLTETPVELSPGVYQFMYGSGDAMQRFIVRVTEE